jgi:broad specificity phosphatase PhoE
MGAIFLVRHGQASFGSDNYDQLSPRGEEQARQLGYAWEAAGWLPTTAASGSMQRHHQTALGALAAAGQNDGYDVDHGWDEFDHEAVLEAQIPGFQTKDPRAFQDAFVHATDRWAAGGNDGDHESFGEFSARVLGAFERLVDTAGKGETSVVFTSGGPIALVVAHLLGDTKLWSTLNSVIINTGVTKIVTGRSGRTLLSFNEHGHLPADQVSYR